MSAEFKISFYLHKLLLIMETDLGLASLTEDERNLLAAVVDLLDEKGSLTSERLNSHILLAKPSHGSYHCALRSLRENQSNEKRGGKAQGSHKLLPNQA